MRQPFCSACGSPDNIQQHHLVPRSLGGTLTVTLCGDCHAYTHQLKKPLKVSSLTSMALARKREKGERINFQVPFGYRLEGDKVVIDDAEQVVIEKVRTLSGQGHSVRAIVRLLEESGYRNRNGKPYGRNEIWKITKKAA